MRVNMLGSSIPSSRYKWKSNGILNFKLIFILVLKNAISSLRLAPISVENSRKLEKFTLAGLGGWKFRWGGSTARKFLMGWLSPPPRHPANCVPALHPHFPTNFGMLNPMLTIKKFFGASKPVCQCVGSVFLQRNEPEI